MTTNFSAKLINVAAAAIAGSFIVAAGAGVAHASSGKLQAHVSISTQTMEVSVDGRTAFTWKVSTARKGYVTPTGSYKPTSMNEMWYSRQYDNAPMPHAVFFNAGYAVHATDAVSRLGRPASHGCVRLAPQNAADFYALVETFGPTNTSIVIAE